MKYLLTYNETYANVDKGKYASFTNTAGDDFWGNVGGGVLPICITTGRVLLPFRSKYVNEPHCWGVWGGKIDEEEGQSENDIVDVVKREFMEESGFDGEITLKPAYIFETPTKSFKYYNFIGLLDHEHKPILNWETETFKWVTFNKLMAIKPKHFGLSGLLNDPASMAIIKKYAR
jgi:8-oxo-dGTP pyrophosphatase MutT (NUDIX family)